MLLDVFVEMFGWNLRFFHVGLAVCGWQIAIDDWLLVVGGSEACAGHIELPTVNGYRLEGRSQMRGGMRCGASLRSAAFPRRREAHSKTNHRSPFAALRPWPTQLKGEMARPVRHSVGIRDGGGSLLCVRLSVPSVLQLRPGQVPLLF